MNARPIKLAVIGGSVVAAVLVGGGVAFAATAPQAAPASAPVAHAATTAATGEASTPETATPSDGPGGHADANGANVDHQFNGNE